MNLHPGGKFVIRHSIGQDISKYFFGGYCMEDNLKGVQKGHVHSYYAKLIVNDLAVGVYE
jgi:cytochrome b involved in lipid metabolism